MGLRKAYRRLKKHKIGRWAVAGATLGTSEAHRIRKKLASSIKKNPELWGAGVGAAFGAPMLGASLGSQLFGGQGVSETNFDAPFTGFSMPGEDAPQMSEQLPEAPSEGGFAPALDKKWLIIGGVALIAVLFLMKQKN